MGYVARVAAKINLSLAVTGKKDNMHELDMILCPVELYDSAEFVPSNSGVRISVRSTQVGFDENLFLKGAGAKIMKAAAALGVEGDILIEKDIPVCAGLGGSSAAIAAAVNTMQEYCKCCGEKKRLDDGFLMSLGSDVPYMCRGGLCKVRGVGNIIEPIAYDKALWFAALIPNSGVDSGKAYAKYDELREMYPQLYVDEAFTLPPRDVDEALFAQRNDLLESAEMLNPDVKNAKETLISAGAKIIVLSGSGSCVAAVCFSEDEAKRIINNCRFDASKHVFKGILNAN